MFYGVFCACDAADVFTDQRMKQMYFHAMVDYYWNSGKNGSRRAKGVRITGGIAGSGGAAGGGTTGGGSTVGGLTGAGATGFTGVSGGNSNSFSIDSIHGRGRALTSYQISQIN